MSLAHRRCLFFVFLAVSVGCSAQSAEDQRVASEILKWAEPKLTTRLGTVITSAMCRDPDPLDVTSGENLGMIGSAVAEDVGLIQRMRRPVSVDRIRLCYEPTPLAAEAASPEFGFRPYDALPSFSIYTATGIRLARLEKVGNTEWHADLIFNVEPKEPFASALKAKGLRFTLPDRATVTVAVPSDLGPAKIIETERVLGSGALGSLSTLWDFKMTCCGSVVDVNLRKEK